MPWLPGPPEAAPGALLPVFAPCLLPRLRRQPQPQARVQTAQREQGQGPGEYRIVQSEPFIVTFDRCLQLKD